MAAAMRGESPCTPTGAAQYTSAQLARFADEHNLTRSVALRCVLEQHRRRIIRGHNEIGFYDHYLWRPPARRLSSLSAIDRRVYNRRSRHSALGMISPVEYENRFTQTAQAASPCVRQTGSRPGGQLGGDGRCGASRRCFRDELAAQHWREVSARVQAGAGTTTDADK